MKTDHEQLIELQPLMVELGWWPDKVIARYGCWWIKLTLLPPEFALAIVTQRAEKELCERGWIPDQVWGEYTEDVHECHKMGHSLADALRVEIGRMQDG